MLSKVANLTLWLLRLINLLKSVLCLCQENDNQVLFRAELHVIFDAESNFWQGIKQQIVGAQE